jgi:CRISPR-associated protein Cmr6
LRKLIRNRPLYNDPVLNQLKFCPPEANLGLWYDKFCDTWRESKRTDKELEIDKKEWINKAINGQLKQSEIHTLQQEAVKRMENLITVKNGKLLFMKTDSRFITGLGNSNPIENGFAWHHTLGTAYIPGTSIKGIARNWAQEWKGADDEEVLRIFGSIKKDQGEKVGSVIFFDALGIKPAKLEIEMLTPHFSKYYKDKKNPPVEWYAPTPIPYMVVAKNQTFVFGVAPRKNDKQGQIDVDKATKWLKEALEWIGAGAKTAIGFGRFSEDFCEKARREQEIAKREEERQKKLKLARMTPIEREMFEDGYEDNKNLFMERIANKWLIRMESMDTPVSDKREIAERLYQWYQQAEQGQERKKKKKRSKKSQQKINQIKAILEKYPK